MNETYLLSIILVFVFTTGLTWLILKFAFDKYQTRKIKNANKKKVYVSLLKVSYIPGTGGLITSKNLSFENDTLEEAQKSQKRLRDIGEKIYERFNSITDKELINIENVLVIPKEKFIAAELTSYTEYK